MYSGIFFEVGGAQFLSLRKEKWRESLFAYLFLLPSLVLFGIFIFYPMLRSFYFSLHLTDPRGRIAHFVGLENFVNLFQDPNFYGSLRVTILFMLLTVPTCIAISTVMAALTNNKMRGMKSFQWIFSMPVVVSVATGSTIWLLLYHPSIGMFNYFLSLLGIDPIFWLASTDWALISVFTGYDLDEYWFCLYRHPGRNEKYQSRHL